MGKESTLQISLVHGGFILATDGEDGYKTEVFTSQGKLMKAIRTNIDANSLVKKEKADDQMDGIGG